MKQEVLLAEQVGSKGFRTCRNKRLDILFPRSRCLFAKQLAGNIHCPAADRRHDLVVEQNIGLSRDKMSQYRCKRAEHSVAMRELVAHDGFDRAFGFDVHHFPCELMLYPPMVKPVLASGEGFEPIHRPWQQAQAFESKAELPSHRHR